MKRRGETQFQPSWTREFPWAKPVEKDPYKAYCDICRKDFAVSSMARQALVSHSTSKKHKSAYDASSKSTPLQVFLERNQALNAATETAPETDSAVLPSSSTGTGSQASGSSGAQRQTSALKDRLMESYLAKDETTKREVMWCMGSVVTHDSLRVSEEKVALFKLMFPDIEEIQQLSLSKAKIAYTIVYGLGPFFRGALDVAVKSCDWFVLGFDESLNQVAQKQQMDIAVRFWDLSKDEVCASYLTSVFIQSCTAEDLLKAFYEGINGYDRKKVLQLSMDGPYVNAKFLRLFKEGIKDEDVDSPDLLEIGSCGLHTVHCAFKAGVKGTGWELVEFLRALYNLFKNAPSRRGHYTKATGSSVFPLKFCSVRWLENGKVAMRAQAILPQLKEYVQSVKDTKQEPDCKSFEIISRLLKDKLLPAKLAFFQSVTESVEPFLREFQTDAPMVPFLYDSLRLLTSSTVERLVTKDVAKSISIFKVDLKKSENLKRAQDVDLGYATREALRQCKNLKDVEVLAFRRACMTCLKLFSEKMLERSPLKYRLTLGASCLNPAIITSVDGALNRLKTALEILVSGKRLSGCTADAIQREFISFCDQETVKNAMKDYEMEKQRLDHFWINLLGNDQRWKNLKMFVKIILILSHGNANLERGFSINKECLVENLHENSLVAQRHVYDAVSAAGGVHKVEITRPMIHAARNAHSRYKEALSLRSAQEKTAKEKALERKRLAEKKTELLASKQQMLSEIEKKRAKILDIDSELKALNDKSDSRTTEKI